MKDVAQMLQSFGTELAETELPDDIPSIEEILAVRAERYQMLKVCLFRKGTHRFYPITLLLEVFLCRIKNGIQELLSVRQNLSLNCNPMSLVVCELGSHYVAQRDLEITI